MQSVSKDVRSIIDKYIHRFKLNMVSDEFYNKYSQYWFDATCYYFDFLTGAAINYRVINNNSRHIYLHIRKLFGTECVCVLPINYVHAKLYK